VQTNWLAISLAGLGALVLLAGGYVLWRRS